MDPTVVIMSTSATLSLKDQETLVYVSAVSHVTQVGNYPMRVPL